MPPVGVKTWHEQVNNKRSSHLAERPAAACLGVVLAGLATATDRHRDRCERRRGEPVAGAGSPCRSGSADAPSAIRFSRWPRAPRHETMRSGDARGRGIGRRRWSSERAQAGCPRGYRAVSRGSGGEAPCGGTSSAREPAGRKSEGWIRRSPAPAGSPRANRLAGLIPIDRSNGPKSCLDHGEPFREHSHP